MSAALIAPGDLAETGTPGAALARLAVCVRDRLARGTTEGRWATPGFAREVELVRSHLRVIGSRTLLAASFGREAFHVTGGVPQAPEPGPVAVAYALRWLELAEDPH